MTSEKKIAIERAIIKPTNACNLDCTYCGAWRDVNGRMSMDTLENIYRSLSQTIGKGSVSIYWHGGEPLMVGLDFYKTAIELQKQFSPTVFKNLMVTNLTLCNDKWAAFFSENDFIIGTSIDGPANIHDKYRQRFNGRGSFQKVIDSLAILRKHNVNISGAIATLHKGNINHVVQIYQTYSDLRLNLTLGYMYPGGLKACKELTISDNEYYTALKLLFDAWLSDQNPVEVDLFEIIISAIINPGQVRSCLNDLVGFNVDGKIFPCHAMIGDPIFELSEISYGYDLSCPNKKWSKIRRMTDDLNEYCQKCEVFGICNGLCPYVNSILWNNPVYTGQDCTYAKDFYIWAKARLMPYLEEYKNNSEIDKYMEV